MDEEGEEKGENEEMERTLFLPLVAAGACENRFSST
jgi:hypothetical protein